MEYVKFTILNLDLIENLPQDMRKELIYLEDVIPDNIMSTIYTHDAIYKEKRGNFLEYRPDILQMMYDARRRRKRLSEKEYFMNVRTDENIEFIKKYPQFKILINSIEFKDENRDTVKVVPIDQYLIDN